MAPARRSIRHTGSRRKYIDDPFKVAGVSEGSDSEEAANKTERKGKRTARDATDSTDEEFVDAHADDSVDDDDHDQIDVPEDGEEALEEPDWDRTAGKRRGIGTGHIKKRRPDGTVALPREDTHSRGTWNLGEYSGKALQLKLTFGTDERDVLAMIYSRDRWCRGIDSTLPTRISLDKVQSAHDYKYGQTFGVEPEEVRRERTQAWDWYYIPSIGGKLRERQRVEKIKEESARRTYMPLPKGKHTVIIGPIDDQAVFHLGQNESVNFGEAWSELNSQERKGRKPSHDKSGEATASAEGKRRVREGWILNIGSKVQCLAWAPNQGGLQHLAVVAPISDEQKKAFNTEEPKEAPAFSPSQPYPSALQIWTFKARQEDRLTKTLDTDFRPRLQLALCTNWGDLRRIAWCPVPRDSREEDDKDALKNTGLLAGVWGDGKVRVLDIKISRDPDATEFYEVHCPNFEARPPSTVCTSVTWLSPSDIAVGCANGYVAVWSILSSEPSMSPLPYIYQQIHSTYVLNLASAYPTHPHLLATTAMDGETRLISLLDPQMDAVETNRMRIASPYISYSPFLQAFLSSDENDFARLLAVRRFFTSTAVAKIQNTISAMAPCSTWHPSALIGSADGTVIATNPVRRQLYSKEKQYQQTWFTHEWARGREAGDSGASRFQDGFVAEPANLLRNLMGDRKLVNSIPLITIFEDGTHVTALAWNPNQLCAGWASAGMGCGIIRVEDLAL